MVRQPLVDALAVVLVLTWQLLHLVAIVEAALADEAPVYTRTTLTTNERRDRGTNTPATVLVMTYRSPVDTSAVTPVRFRDSSLVSST